MQLLFLKLFVPENNNNKTTCDCVAFQHVFNNYFNSIRILLIYDAVGRVAYIGLTLFFL